MEKACILLIEDDNDIQNSLSALLRLEQYTVKQAFSGTEGLLLLTPEVDLILLDLMLPGLSGEDLLPRVRERSELPILVISGKSALDAKVRALELGADDYLTKPFERAELCARIRVALRRSRLYMSKQAPSLLQLGDLCLDLQAHSASFAGEELHLTATEFALLELMMSEPKQAFSRDRLYREIWQDDFMTDDNALNVHISHLRSKLREASGRELIETVWGIGYRLAQL